LQPIDAFIVGVPKAGTTWLANTLSQHPDIQLSNPKEPNIVSSHKGTFDRITKEPDWSDYDNCFTRPGLRIDASVHTFACPLSPERIFRKIPNMKFILCLREPVSRTISHWNMVKDTQSDADNNVDWTDFSVAWSDARLKDDTMYGKSMTRWLEYFSIDNFLIIDSQQMKDNPNKILSQIDSFLKLKPNDYTINLSKHTNSATNRRPLTHFGKICRFIFANIPNLIKKPIVIILQSRDITVYSIPIISKKPILEKTNNNHYPTCSDIIISDLKIFEKITGFSTAHWVKEINHRCLNINEIS
jgi:hypothetical protein